jgi:DNA-binding SARP family transcriptional activator
LWHEVGSGRTGSAWSPGRLAGGRQLRLGPALRVLLLCLLCADGELVLAGRLAGLLSETGSPGGSPATLRSHVSHLRRAISDATGRGRDDRDSVIVTDRVGGATAYALRLDADKVDASRFAECPAAGCQSFRGTRTSQ